MRQHTFECDATFLPTLPGGGDGLAHGGEDQPHVGRPVERSPRGSAPAPLGAARTPRLRHTPGCESERPREVCRERDRKNVGDPEGRDRASWAAPPGWATWGEQMPSLCQAGAQRLSVFPLFSCQPLPGSPLAGELVFEVPAYTCRPGRS